MCGIAGILTNTPGRGDSCAPLRRMQRVLAHRGPDGDGSWSAADGHAAFAHVRLAIVDLSPGARQPMTSPDGRFTIVHNGEIYNAAELRRELESRGARFHTRTDTEVILHAYATFGAGAVERLRGMFAFAIWDAVERSCFLARDPFGIKPLYYCDHRGQLLFASELRALLASGRVPPEIDPTALYGYFRAGSVQEPRTLLREVKVLPAGYRARWRDGQLAVSRYWSLDFAEEDASDGVDVAARTREALLDSVRHHLVSDVPVGVFLSGGMDSTALVALARAAGAEGVRTFTLSLPGSAGDEGPVARRTAAHLGTRHDEWRVHGAEGRAMFRRYLAASDQPSIDGLNTFVAAAFARERGVKVVLSGLGADELFGGYPSFRAVPRLARWHGRLARVTPARHRVGRLVERASAHPKLRRLGDLFAQPPGLESAYSTFRGVFTTREAWTLACRYAPHDAGPDEEVDVDGSTDPTAVDAVSRMELTRYVRNQLLRDSDVMSMASGVEVRTPYLDVEVVRALSRIPAGVRLQEGKRLLARAVPEVPAWVAGQPKRCFSLPVEQWMDGEWRDMFANVERRSPVPTGAWYRSCAILAFEHWQERARRAQGTP